MKKKLVILTLSICLVSCSRSSSAKIDIIDTQKNINISCLDNLEFVLGQVGCSCSFYFSNKNANCESIMFLRDWGDELKIGKSRGWFNISGKNQSLLLNKLEGVEGMNGESWLESYSNSSYEIAVDIKAMQSSCGEFNSSCEVFDTEGVLSIKSNGGTQQTIPIYGECGC